MLYYWLIVGLVIGLPLAVLGFLRLRVLIRAVPEEHTATSRITLRATPEQVFPSIAEIRELPGQRVQMLPERQGMQVARVRRGGRSWIVVRTRCEPPLLVERTFTDEQTGAGATWLFKVRAVPAGCEVRLTETARVPSVAHRLLLKYVFGYHKYTHARLRELAKEFAQDARPHRA